MQMHKDITTRAQQDFYGIEDRCNILHNNKYDYSKVIYKNNKTKVTIICPIHGEFEQPMRDHLSGHGCRDCAIIFKAQGLTKNIDNWVKDAKQVHGDKYDYSKVRYKNKESKVLIICPIHGEFTQTAGNHIMGKGCSKCKYEQHAALLKKTTEQFITEALVLNENKYTYHKVNYINNHTKVTITCPHHGDFQQRPNDHLNGSGCIKCAETGFNPTKPAYLYYLSVLNGTAYKIGITNLTVEKRFNNNELKDIQILKTWYYNVGQDAYNEEQRILKEFKEFKYIGDNLLVSGNTELFNQDVLQLDHTI